MLPESNSILQLPSPQAHCLRALSVSGRLATALEEVSLSLCNAMGKQTKRLGVPTAPGQWSTARPELRGTMVGETSSAKPAMGTRKRPSSLVRRFPTALRTLPVRRRMRNPSELWLRSESVEETVMLTHWLGAFYIQILRGEQSIFSLRACKFFIVE